MGRPPLEVLYTGPCIDKATICTIEAGPKVTGRGGQCAGHFGDIRQARTRRHFCPLGSYADGVSMKLSKLILPTLLSVTMIAACGGSDGGTSEQSAPATAADTGVASGFTLVSAEEAAATIADPPADLVILDVRTPEEFAEGHIEGAIMVDFYSEDFDAQLAGLDPDVPYVVYCRSGNRSGQTIAKMETIGFQSVDDIDGGVVAWADAGLPLVR
ncbi:MAG: hypothetical protein DRJ50_08280 [Actinobacteria bacterium]|nr:MAG: hypothetical protein DRJ50_08280 [Actinomycetota bacterium]